MRTYHSCLPSYYNSQEKQFLKGTLGRKSQRIMIKGKLMELKAVTYFYKKLHHRSLAGFQMRL